MIRLFETPGLSLRSNPGLKLANAFGVFIQISISEPFGVFIQFQLANAFGVFIQFSKLTQYRSLTGFAQKS